MLELFALYRWTILAGGVMAIALSLLGCHLAARDRAMQTLCVAQGATLGALLGMGILHALLAEESRVHYSPLLLAMSTAGVAYWVGELVAKGRSASRNTYLAALFVTLLSASALVSALFPALESHMAQVFFGDLATLTDRDSSIALTGAILAAVWLVVRWRVLSDQTFEIAVLPESAPLRRYPIDVTCFSAIALLLLAFSVQFVGFLFTAGCLFLPTSILATSRAPGLARHLFSCAVVAVVGTVVGFSLSLALPRLPTVPAIIAMLGVTAVGWRVISGRARG